VTESIAEIHAALTAPGQPFEMVEVAIRGVPTRTWRSAAANLREVLEASRARADDTFLVYEDERLSFGAHADAAAAMARALHERWGVGKGDRVAIAMRNFPEWSVAFWAATSLGAVVVPLNAWWTGPELEYGITDSGARVLFCDLERLERLRAHLPALDLAAVVVAKAGGADIGDALRHEEVLGTPRPGAPLPTVAIDPEDDATIFYTSGTTGRPKGALGTHRNICTNLVSLLLGQARNAARAGGQTGAGDAAPAAPPVPNAYLLSVPFFHATGCHSVLAANLAFGGKIVIMHKWDPERALELIERERVTTFGGVPSMVWQVLESPSFATRDLSSVRSIGYGGAPAPPELVRRIEAMFPGRTPSNGYGLTETSSVTTQNIGADYVRKPDSVGVPVPVCDVQVVGPEGDPLPAGEVGELWIRGPNVVKGYWAKPEATADAFVADGWFRSGDIARIDDEGFVFIVDRAKDMVIRGGENVYCAEVEGALFEHPAVTDVAVFGVPHQVLGEEVAAVVCLRPGASATAEELKAHVRERLAAFKVPAHLWFRAEELPRNPAGKVLKRELRDELAGTAAGR
jgi:long-chain acyl-CoA synthetase